MVQIRSFSTGGAGVQNTLASGEDFIMYGDVELFSEDESVIVSNGSNNILIGPNATVASFSSSNSRPTLKLGDTTGAADYVTISTGATIYAQSTAISSDFNNNEILNYGTIVGNTTGVDLDGLYNAVHNYGTITGSNSIAIRVFASSSIYNHGEVSGAQYGLVLRDGGGEIFNSGVVQSDTAAYMDGPVTHTNVITNTLNNSGELLGDSYGVFSIRESSFIVNSGLISSTSTSRATISQVQNVADDTHILINSGQILSAGIAYTSNLARDVITNTGTIVGDVFLGSNDDVYRGASGLVTGLIDGGDGDDLISGGAEANVILVSSGINTLRGNGGDDTLTGGTGADKILGGDGNDIITGGADADTLRGGDGDDQVFGEDGDDLLKGGDGDDVLDGGLGEDTLYGGNDDDQMMGGAQRDEMFGGRGDDDMNGGSGADLMIGGAGNDILQGGLGADTLNGGSGDDRLTGNGSADIFVFERSAGNDVITDFTDGSDRIDLSDFGLRPSDYNSIVDPALSNAGSGDTLLDLNQLGGTGSIVIENLTFGDADASDFIF